MIVVASPPFSADLFARLLIVWQPLQRWLDPSVVQIVLSPRDREWARLSSPAPELYFVELPSFHLWRRRRYLKPLRLRRPGQRRDLVLLQ